MLTLEVKSLNLAWTEFFFLELWEIHGEKKWKWSDVNFISIWKNNLEGKQTRQKWYLILTFDMWIHEFKVLIPFPETCVSLAKATPWPKFLTQPLTQRAAAAFKICSWVAFDIFCSKFDHKILSAREICLTSESAIAPFSPDSTSIRSLAVSLGPTLSKHSRVHRWMPKYAALVQSLPLIYHC